MLTETRLLLFALFMVSGGCSMAWLPLGPIVLGSLLLAGLIWVRMRRMPAQENEGTDDDVE